MNGKWTRLAFVLCLVVAGGWSAVGDAAPPWANLLSLKRVDADPDKDYSLHEDNGPWMIVACPFSGPGAEEQARHLVLELRKRYKLEAYLHRKHFEFGATRGRGVDPTGAPIRMHHRINDLQEVAVLVGNYQSVDDPNAQKTLRQLKYSHPQCLQVSEERPTYQSLGALREIQKRLLAAGNPKKQKGPMGRAFITPNPLISKEIAASPGLDPVVLKANEPAEHSLLDCPGKYTVQVATFKGKVITNQREIQAVKRGKKVKSALADAALKAHLLTEALRKKGWEAYEFHDRYASIVTVGSFQSIGMPRADGRIEINPGIHAIMETFGAQQVTLPGQPHGATSLKTLIDIPFDVQAIPVHVPKRSIGRELAQRPH